MSLHVEVKDKLYFLGQPLAVMMYYHDFVVEHFGADLIQSYGQISSFNTSTTILV